MFKQAFLAAVLLLAPSVATTTFAAAVPAAPVPASAPATGAVASTPTPAININTADAATLARELKGIGEVKARAIVEYREAQGPFEQVEDLLEVQGIGTGLLESNRSRLSVN